MKVDVLASSLSCNLSQHFNRHSPEDMTRSRDFGTLFGQRLEEEACMGCSWQLLAGCLCKQAALLEELLKDLQHLHEPAAESAVHQQL